MYVRLALGLGRASLRTPARALVLTLVRLRVDGGCRPKNSGELKEITMFSRKQPGAIFNPCANLFKASPCCCIVKEAIHQVHS